MVVRLSTLGTGRLYPQEISKKRQFENLVRLSNIKRMVKKANVKVRTVFI
jgi:hypothetical protein